MNLDISNVINISVSQNGQGVGKYNTSNLALFTNELPVSFGTDKYRIYLSPSDVATDFGNTGNTYKMALAVFSQQPNILANGGYLVIIPLLVAKQTITFDQVPDGGHFVINFSQGATAQIQFSAVATDVQTAVRAIAGLEKATVAGDFTAGFTITLGGVYGAEAILTISSNTLVKGVTPIVETPAIVNAGEILGDAITRTSGLVQYFGLMSTVIHAQADLLATAAVVQPLLKIGFFVSRTATDVDPGGKLDLLRTGNFTRSRGLFYGSSTDIDALVFQASYASRGLSTNFSGSKTTQTMHLKDMSGVQPDPSMTQTLLNKCVTAGADTYVSIQGVAKVFCSGLNDFFDNIYNLLWFVGDLQIAGFNVLAQTSTKIAQTEEGVDSLKSAYRGVCEQAVTNEFAAPGAWTNPTTFGNQADLIANIAQRGYYIYSLPVAQQDPADRAARKAPLIQIALKYAGATHSSTVIVNVNK